MNNFDTADVCEEAHKRTVEECKKKGIVLDNPFIDSGDIKYTDEAQVIFDRHFDEVEQEFSN